MLFQSLVTLSVRVYAQAAEARVFHLRTHGGEHEVDLIASGDVECNGVWFCWEPGSGWVPCDELESR